MHVVATAGHVDHGKSTLVRRLTGSDPDRLAAEKRRGLSIELGYAWTDLPSGQRLAFVDVPGHERFLGAMLAGVGPVPAVVLVVAADEGWSRQTEEHVAALDALGVQRGLLVVTKADRADPAPVAADVRERLSGTTLAGIPCAASGSGHDRAPVLAALDALVATLPVPDATAPVRLFVDRVFTIRGSGTVVTGTLTAGGLTVGDRMEIAGRPVRVRGLQCCGEAVGSIGAVARVAVNLTGVDRAEIRRGDALVSAGAAPATGRVEVSLRPRGPVPRQLVLHVGSAAVPCRVHDRGDGTARLTLDRPIPLLAGDRGVLHDTGRHAVAAGVTVLRADCDGAVPPERRHRRTRDEIATELPVTELPVTGAQWTGLQAAWAAGPYAAPDGEALQRLGIDRRTLAALATAGLAVRPAPDVVLPMGADGRALEALRALDQPFTIADAKAALGVSRRVAVPLLELLDRQRRTRRDGERRWVRGAG